MSRPILHTTTLSDPQLVSSQALIPIVTEAVCPLRPNPDPEIVVIMAPVAGAFPRRTVLISADSTDKERDKLPREYPLLTITPRLPVDPWVILHASEVSDVH